jgi:hypothetical protein
MAFQVCLFLLMTFLLFCLLRLWPFCWSHHGSAQSRTVAKMRSMLHRLLKPHTPLDCPACRLASTPSSVVRPPPAPVRPWLYWLLNTSVRESGTLGFHRPPLSCHQVGFSHRKSRGMVFMYRRKQAGMGSRPSGKAYKGCRGGLPMTSSDTTL